MRYRDTSLKFSLLRMMIAVSVFAIPFAMFASFGFAGKIIATIVGLSLFSIALGFRAFHWKQIIRIIVSGSIGIILGLMSMPPVNSSAGNDIQRIIAGLVFGCICGLIWNTCRYEKDMELQEYCAKLANNDELD